MTTKDREMTAEGAYIHKPCGIVLKTWERKDPKKDGTHNITARYVCEKCRIIIVCCGVPGSEAFWFKNRMIGGRGIWETADAEIGVRGVSA